MNLSIVPPPALNLVAGDREHGRHLLAEAFGINGAREVRGFHHVGEQHCHNLALFPAVRLGQ